MTELKRTPSLLEPESSGGDTASGGFDFQMYLILVKIPQMLSYQGFTSLIRESISDIESKFYMPGEGTKLEAIEAKNHRISPSEFWEEIKRFEKIDAGSPNTYQWFTLACTELSLELSPLLNSLRRIRDPYDFFSPESGVIENSYNDYVSKVIKMGKDKKTADFLFSKVLIENNWAMLEHQGVGIFQHNLSQYLPQYEELSGKASRTLFYDLLTLVQSKKNQPINRIEFEDKFKVIVEQNGRIISTPIKLETAIDDISKLSPKLVFKWAKFFGGSTRDFPPFDDWNGVLIQQINETKEWILKNLQDRTIRLTGNRRLSTSIAFGYIFSAVSGFNIEIEYREELWSTKAFPCSTTPDYDWKWGFEHGEGSELTIALGVIREIESEVKTYINEIGNGNMSFLTIFSEVPLVSDQQVNLAVLKLKTLISKILAEKNIAKIHLFFAGPSHLALFLGHRLNATVPIQCYEWIRPNTYIATCLLQ